MSPIFCGEPKILSNCGSTYDGGESARKGDTSCRLLFSALMGFPRSQLFKTTSSLRNPLDSLLLPEASTWEVPPFLYFRLANHSSVICRSRRGEIQPRAWVLLPEPTVRRNKAPALKCSSSTAQQCGAIFWGSVIWDNRSQFFTPPRE